MAAVLKPIMLLAKGYSRPSRLRVPPSPEAHKPQSPQYYAALWLLEWLESVDAKQVPGWASQLDSARTSLESAWSEESGTCLATDGFLLVEAARIEFLAANFTEAERLFNLARDYFRSAGLIEQANNVDEIATSLVALRG
jgi:hypothetical protein